MRKEEAQLIAQCIGELPLPEGAVCLNIGSSTRHFRESVQPHINDILFSQLDRLGLRVIHCDIKDVDGVDVVGDVFDTEFQQRLRQADASLLLCCNLLEHVTDARRFASVCRDFVRPGGFLVASVPLSYPYHADPIDTMLRPTPEELQSFFPGWDPVKKLIVVSETFLQETLQKPSGKTIIFKHLARAALPFYKSKQWWPIVHRLTWLFRPYKTSLVVMRRPVETS